MPNPNTDGTTAAAINADKANLSEMSCSAHAPYHLVNTNVIHGQLGRFQVAGEGRRRLIAPARPRDAVPELPR